MNGSDTNRANDESDENRVDYNALDGFAISSSSRPFHLNQFCNECHTWPTDSEFSWSAIQSDKETDINYQTDSMAWTTKSDKLTKLYNAHDETNSSSVHRPDSGISGVGESVRLMHIFSILWAFIN